MTAAAVSLPPPPPSSAGQRLPLDEGARLRGALEQLGQASRAIEHHRCRQRLVDLTAPEVPPAQQYAAQQVRAAALAQQYRAALAAAQGVRDERAGMASSHTQAAAILGLELGAGDAAAAHRLVGRLTLPASVAMGVAGESTRSILGPGQLRRLNAVFAL